MRHLRLIAVVLGGLLLLGTPLALSVNYLEPQERGLTWNVASGELGVQARAGWHAHPPWVLVSVVDIRPARVCITTSARAVLNCKLVRFVPEHYRTFISVQGFGFYWWANRFSFNFGYREEYRGMRDILRGYAFSSKQYPFIEVLEEYESLE